MLALILYVFINEYARTVTTKGDNARNINEGFLKLFLIIYSVKLLHI